jgi:antitoxin (DNA-binding transcriptional repressor) of toxin-antitoxin stability system
LKLLDLVENGESVVIERHGRPVAQLVPGRKRGVSPL